MAITVIKVGAAANDGTGDPLRDAMVEVNSNFSQHTGDIASATSVAQGAQNASEAAALAASRAQQTADSKADEQSTIEALALKANSIDVTEALDLKANIADVNQSLDDVNQAVDGVAQSVEVLDASLSPVAKSGAAADLQVAPAPSGLLSADMTAQAAFNIISSRTVNTYPANAIPTNDVGPISVIGLGLMEWKGGAYAPASRKGTTDGSNAATGIVGEYMALDPAGTGTGNNIVWNHGNLTLTPGDWDVTAGAAYSAGTVTGLWVSIADTATTLTSDPPRITSMSFPAGTAVGVRLHLGPVRLNVSANKILYLNTQWVGTVATTVQPYMHARRVR